MGETVTANRYGSTTETYNWNREYGFGVVDAKAAVDAAKTWMTLAPLESVEVSSSDTLNQSITDGSDTGTSHSLTIGSGIEFIEFVEVRAEFSHPSFRDLEIELSSPTSGSSVMLLSHFDSDGPIPLNGTIRFGASRFLGEDPDGSWTLTVKDRLGNSLSGTLDSWTLKIYGHKPTPFAPIIDDVEEGEELLTVKWSAPTQDRGGDITSYDLLYKEENGDEEILTGIWSSGDLEYDFSTLSGGSTLVGGVEYILQVRAVNSSGAGEWSEAKSGTPQVTSGDCDTSTGVTTGTDLEDDCNALLEMRDDLVGRTGTALNWSPGVSIFQWDGVTAGLRVTALELSDMSLAGRIPTEIGDLSGLVTLDLSDNALTGSIPSQLGALIDPGEPLSATNTAKLRRADDPAATRQRPERRHPFKPVEPDHPHGTAAGRQPSDRLPAVRGGAGGDGLAGYPQPVVQRPVGEAACRSLLSLRCPGDPLKLQGLSVLDLGGNSFGPEAFPPRVRQPWRSDGAAAQRQRA